MLHAFHNVVLRLRVGDQRTDEPALQYAIEISSPRNAVSGWAPTRFDLTGWKRRFRWTLG